MLINTPMPITIHEWPGIEAAPNPAVAFSGDVQVWLGVVPATQAEVAACVRLLDETERLRASRFQNAAAHDEFVFGRAMLRLLLGGCMDIDPAKVAIGHGIRGKPRLADGTEEGGLRFNLAHSRSLVAIALAWRREVGVDIEWTERSVDWPSIAGHIFSARELRELRELPPTEQELAFYTGWTRKEAYLKAIGEGLCGAISAIEVTVTPGKPAALLRPAGASEAPKFWEIHDIPLPAGFAGALVVEKSARGGQGSSIRDLPETL